MPATTMPAIFGARGILAKDRHVQLLCWVTLSHSQWTN